MGVLFCGGLFLWKHFLFRLLLWASRAAPLNYVRFLDAAADRLFLRKVGGGYIFTHRLLMEYFASLPSNTAARHQTLEPGQTSQHKRAAGSG